jgi:hypothetical protein
MKMKTKKDNLLLQILSNHKVNHNNSMTPNPILVYTVVELLLQVARNSRTKRVYRNS